MTAGKLLHRSNGLAVGQLRTWWHFPGPTAFELRCDLLRLCDAGRVACGGHGGSELLQSGDRQRPTFFLLRIQRLLLAS